VPGWLGSFCVVLPFLATLLGLLAGLYALYVLYLGLPVVMRAPKEKALSYTVAVILSGMLVGIALAAVSMAVGATAHFGLPSQQPNIGAQQGAAAAGNILGNVLGTDDQGKAALGQALGNLARAGEQMEQAKANTAPSAQAPANPATTSAAADGTNANANVNVNADTAANAGAALGSLMTAFGGALGGSHRVTPVDFRTLQELLPPSVAGMTRGAAEGENKEALGVKESSANATYSGPAGSQIQVTISDVSGVSGLIDIAGGLSKTTDSQTATGFERDTKVSGRSVHEKYTTANRSGELQLIVGKRFEVEVDGHGVDIATLEHALSQVDLARLESMKNVGAQN
jgi:Yip1 domain